MPCRSGEKHRVLLTLEIARFLSFNLTINSSFVTSSCVSLVCYLLKRRRPICCGVLPQYRNTPRKADGCSLQISCFCFCYRSPFPLDTHDVGTYKMPLLWSHYCTGTPRRLPSPEFRPARNHADDTHAYTPAHTCALLGVVNNCTPSCTGQRCHK